MINPLNTTKSIRAQKKRMHRMEFRKKLVKDLQEFEEHFQQYNEFRPPMKIMLRRTSLKKEYSRIKNLKTEGSSTNITSLQIMAKLSEINIDTNLHLELA
jgi:hypothetical protein